MVSFVQTLVDMLHSKGANLSYVTKEYIRQKSIKYRWLRYCMTVQLSDYFLSIWSFEIGQIFTSTLTNGKRSADKNNLKCITPVLCLFGDIFNLASINHCGH